MWLGNWIPNWFGSWFGQISYSRVVYSTNVITQIVPINIFNTEYIGGTYITDKDIDLVFS